MIRDVLVKKLGVHKDERGHLFEILRSDDPHFKRFGQVYVTVCNPGWVKGWHYHKKQTDIFCVIRGKSRIVLHDLRKNSKTERQTNIFILSEKTPSILEIPRGVIHGFECLGKEPAWILNVPDHTYNAGTPDEYRLPLDAEEIPYKPWKKRKGW
jgi:dTDP-4-dehydrorhamnose 3,5-epimerase